MEAGAEVGAAVAGGDAGGALPDPGVTLLIPNQSRTSVACSGTVWPTPCARMAWTLGPDEAREYPAWGLLVTFVAGVCETPKTLVHCLMSSQKFCG